MDWMGPLPKPSRTFHAVCAYWLISSDGSTANAQAHPATSNEDKASVSATGCRTHPPTELSAQHLIASGASGFPDIARSFRSHASRTKVQWTTLKEGSTLLPWSFEETVCFDHSFRSPVFLHTPECSAANPRMLPSPAA